MPRRDPAYPRPAGRQRAAGLRQDLRKAYAEETALIDGLLLDLAKADVSEALKTLHLDTYVAQLKTLNDAYKALDITRTDEYSARVKTDTTKARKATDETLDLIIQRVNAYAVLEPTEAINAFIDTVNQIFRKYKTSSPPREAPPAPPSPTTSLIPHPTLRPTPRTPAAIARPGRDLSLANCQTLKIESI